MKRCISIFENDPHMKVIVQEFLEDRGYEVALADDLSEVRQHSDTKDASLGLINLDIDPEGVLSFSHQMNSYNKSFSTILTTEKGSAPEMPSPNHIVLRRPFRMRDLLEIIELTEQENKKKNMLYIPGFYLDVDARKLYTNEHRHVHLTKTEFELLVFFIGNPNRVLERASIIKSVWGDNIFVVERTVDNFVSMLNKKFRQHNASENRPKIVAARGVGYRFELD